MANGFSDVFAVMLNGATLAEIARPPKNGQVETHISFLPKPTKTKDKVYPKIWNFNGMN